jgi:hypothetical protein
MLHASIYYDVSQFDMDVYDIAEYIALRYDETGTLLGRVVNLWQGSGATRLSVPLYLFRHIIQGPTAQIFNRREL